MLKIIVKQLLLRVIYDQYIKGKTKCVVTYIQDCVHPWRSECTVPMLLRQPSSGRCSAKSKVLSETIAARMFVVPNLFCLVYLCANGFRIGIYFFHLWHEMRCFIFCCSFFSARSFFFIFSRSIHSVQKWCLFLIPWR